MIDEDIETHIQTQLAAAFPGIDPDQVLIQFLSGSVDASTATRRRDNAGNWTYGEETLTVQVTILNGTKQDRFKVIRVFPRGTRVFTSGRSFQRFTRWVQQDLIEPALSKGLAFWLEYKHEIFPS